MAPNKSEYEKLLPEIRALTDEVVRQNMADGVLVSAGVDTSVIAYHAVKYKPQIPALTMSFKHDQHFAKPSSVYSDKRGRQCPQCKSYVKTELGFCKVCGNYPI